VPDSSISTQLLVIGGGATGLGIAWDACLRSLKVIVVEQSDLGQGTSGRYHGLLHSGGRYVISDPVSARDCAAENATLRRILPQAIEDTGGLFVTTPADPPEFADRWRTACRDAHVIAEEWDVSKALKHEPLLNPRMSRAFHVADASLDSFDLLHLLAEAIRRAGGQILLRHQVVSLDVSRGRLRSASLIESLTGRRRVIGAEILINAAGPWSGAVASLAGIHLPVVLSKGSMIAMTSRLVHTVVNRCRPPQDGDIVVPVGTVAVLGTTDIEVDDPADHRTFGWEVDKILAEGEVLIPTLSSHRPWRSWAGVRALYRPNRLRPEDTRDLPRAHAVLDHASTDGIDGLLSVVGGKLTTFRLMAEDTLDLACRKMGIVSSCRTAETPIDETTRSIVCECELATRMGLEHSLTQDDARSLDDSRRDLRLGMGPCQAAFCAYRAAALTVETTPTSAPDGGYRTFLRERWRGMRPLAWGKTLSQFELSRRISIELLAADTLDEDPS
jgi:glycerol-3-phosphate dehydrogenase